MPEISYNFHKAVLRRDGEVIAEVRTTVDRDAEPPLFLLSVVDHDSACGKNGEENRLAITFNRADAFLVAVAKLSAMKHGNGGEIEVPPGFPGDESVRVRYRGGRIKLSKGRAYVYEDAPL